MGKTGNGTAWVNSDLMGAVTADEDVRLQDDFHTAVNHDWLIKARPHPGEPSMSAFRERMDEVERQVEDLLDDTSISGHEADLVHHLHGAYLDMETRDARGIAPLRTIVERIGAIASLADLDDYLTSDARFLSTTLMASEVFTDKKDSERYVVYLGPDDLSLVDANEYRNLTDQGRRTKEANRVFFSSMLARIGYSESEAEHADELRCGIEQRIGTACLGADAQGRDDFQEITYNLRTLDELRASAARYPIERILEARGLSASRRFVLEEPDWLSRMGELYTEDNLEGMKTLLLFRAISRFAPFLDDECYGLVESWKNARLGSSGSTPLARRAYDLTNGLLGMAVGRMYVDRYLTDETKSDVEGLIGKVIDTYRTRLAGADWLTDETRTNAIEKLDAMTVRVGRPTSWPHYEDLEVDADEDLVSMVAAIRLFEQDRQAAKVNGEVDREEWLMPPHVVNAYYLPTDNSINILAGILGGVFYDAECGPQGRMGGIGMIIGHEITHAFDRSGSLYDKEGNLKASWWTDEDRAAFKERTDRVADYWDAIEVLPGRNIDGTLTAAENTADLGGMSCMVAIGHMIPGFDWKAFFTAYARNWRLVESPELAEFLLVNDVHAPGHLRTNAVVSQFEEFQDAFDVKPGDGMYLESERRLSVW